MTKTAVVFPGQGAQAVGMAADLIEAHPEARVWFDRASAVLGFDLAKVCFEGPVEELTRSDHAQPAIFVHSVVAYELWKTQTGAEVSAAAGLSSGEWAALYAADVVDFEDAIRILKARGTFMQAACDEQEGGMVSIIGLADDKILAICDQVGIQVANYNSPGQTVVSGLASGTADVPAMAKEAGAKLAIPLTVAGAFHSRLMQSGEDQFAEFLKGVELREPKFPVASNVTGELHGSASGISELMAKQITSSVQWVKDVQALQAMGVGNFVECGPGKVLTGLAKRIDKSLTATNVSTLPSLQKAVEADQA